MHNAACSTVEYGEVLVRVESHSLEQADHGVAPAMGLVVLLEHGQNGQLAIPGVQALQRDLLEQVDRLSAGVDEKVGKMG